MEGEGKGTKSRAKALQDFKSRRTLNGETVYMTPCSLSLP